MGPRFLLDTNICIYIRRKKPEEVLQRFQRLAPGEAVISIITFGELIYGAAKSKRSGEALHTLGELSEILPVATLPESAAESCGTIRAELERKGQMIGNNDLWIAAHAQAADLTLVTNNDREFKRIFGLKIQNWVVPA